MLQCLILASLTNDDASLLSVFLTSLKEKIVDNTTLSKTTKLKMFNTKIMMKLLEAYTWTGPKQGKKSDLKMTNSSMVHNFIKNIIPNSFQLSSIYFRTLKLRF